MKEEENKKKNPLNAYIKYSGLAIQMIVTMCLGAWVGFKLDAYFKNANHLFTVFILLLSVIASMYFVISSLNRK